MTEVSFHLSEETFLFDVALELIVIAARIENAQVCDAMMFAEG